MILMYRFVRKIGKGRTCKSNKWYSQCPSIYSNHFFKYFCHNSHYFLASYCLRYYAKFKFTRKKKFYEQISKHKDNKIIKAIYLLTSKQSTSTAWSSFREGVITASFVHEHLPKLNSKTLFHKNKASINLCPKIHGYQKKSKKSKSLERGTSKEKIARKRYDKKHKSSHINFQCQESGLFVS